MAYNVYALSPSDWKTFERTGTYRPPSLDEEGFVHCSKPEQIVLVADTVHADSDEMVLLLLDEPRFESPVRYETNGDRNSAFPHVYGPLTLDTVVETFDFEQDETGFRLPKSLLNY